MHLEILVAVVLAMGLGAAIGLEREVAGKPAGLRTNMIVAGASALLVRLSDLLVDQFGAELSSPGFVRVDPTRVIEAVVTGVSFIGAGTIIRRSSRLEVEGLTTAATLLLTAAVGIAAALSAEWLAVSVTVMVLIILRVVAYVEQKVETKLKGRTGEPGAST